MEMIVKLILWNVFNFFSSGIGYRNARFGSGTGQIWLDELNCTGTEISLSQCVSSNAGVHDCSHLEDASMQCFRRGEANILF